MPRKKNSRSRHATDRKRERNDTYEVYAVSSAAVRDADIEVVCKSAPVVQERRRHEKSRRGPKASGNEVIQRPLPKPGAPKQPGRGKRRVAVGNEEMDALMDMRSVSSVLSRIDPGLVRFIYKYTFSSERREAAFRMKSEGIKQATNKLPFLAGYTSLVTACNTVLEHCAKNSTIPVTFMTDEMARAIYQAKLAVAALPSDDIVVPEPEFQPVRVICGITVQSNARDANFDSMNVDMPGVQLVRLAEEMEYSDYAFGTWYVDGDYAYFATPVHSEPIVPLTLTLSRHIQTRVYRGWVAKILGVGGMKNARSFQGRRLLDTKSGVNLKCVSPACSMEVSHPSVKTVEECVRINEDGLANVSTIPASEGGFVQVEREHDSVHRKWYIPQTDIGELPFGPLRKEGLWILDLPFPQVGASVLPLTTRNYLDPGVNSWVAKVALLGGGKKKKGKRDNSVAAAQLKSLNKRVNQPLASQRRRERPVNISGMIKTAVKGALEGVGATAGGLIASRMGGGMAAPSGASYGRKVGAYISRIIGSGDYSMNEERPVTNSLISGPMPKDASFQGYSGQVLRVTHREYAFDLFTGPTAGVFNNTEYAINPGNISLFPFLAQLAKNYEKYRFHGLVVELISTSSPYNATSAMGSAIASCQFNTNAEPFTSKIEMENSNEAVSARFDKNILYGVECASQAATEYYIETQYAQTSQTLLYTLANLNIATAPATGYATNSVTHEVWVSYDVSLIGPRLLDETSGYYMGTMASCALTNPFGITTTQVQTGAFQGLQVIGNGIVIDNVAPGDCIYITCTWADNTNAGGSTVVTWTAASNCTLCPSFPLASGYNTSQLAKGSGTASTYVQAAACILQVGDGSVGQCAVTALGTSGTLPFNGVIRIMYIGSGLTTGNPTAGGP